MLEEPRRALPGHAPWKRLLCLNICVLLLILLALLQELLRKQAHFQPARARRSQWELRGAARSLRAGAALGAAAPGRRSDGLGALWDPVCQLPQEPLAPGSVFVELCVSSELSQRLRRDAIRAGYGKHAAGLNASLRFFVGEPTPGTHDVYSIESERRQHGDLVILPFRDTYENLTLKSLAMMSYAAACGSAPYLVKADDDVRRAAAAPCRARGAPPLCPRLPPSFLPPPRPPPLPSHAARTKVMVYIARLRRFLEKMDADAAMTRSALGVYSGTLWVNTPPIVAKGNKNEESKWTLSALPRNESLASLPRGKHFFPYAGGPFYLMSRAAGEFLRRNAHRLNWRWRNEDMAVGTWFIGADIDTINTFQVKVLHWRWSTKPYIALHNIDDRHRIAEWHVELGGNTTLS